MKTVFVPASDELLNDQSLGEINFVPFNPEYLNQECEVAATKDRPPRNWITPSTFEDALNRLRAQAELTQAH